MKIKFLFLAFFLTAIMAACTSSGPQAIRYGQDQCVYCKMTISDARFGTQLVTNKGKAYNFDDLQCMIAFVKSGEVSKEDISAFYLPDYANDNKLMVAEDMLLLKSEGLNSPMRGNIAAFSTVADLEAAQQHLGGGELLSWDDLWK